MTSVLDTIGVGVDNMSFQPCIGVNGTVKKVLDLIHKETSTCLIITKNGTETDQIQNGLIRRLNNKQVPYEADLDQKTILAKITTIHIHSEMQLHQIRLNEYQQVLYNPMIDHDTYDTLKTRFGS